MLTYRNDSRGNHGTSRADPCLKSGTTKHDQGTETDGFSSSKSVSDERRSE